MGKEVSSAIGTQRQFAKQPEMPYQLNLNSPNFYQGLDPRNHVNYDAQLLAKSLGVIPKAIMNEMMAQEKRDQDQATLVNADKMLAGQDKESLKKFDRMTALTNSSDQFDLSDNKYAMAALEKGIGKMASTYAKQQWAEDPRSQNPKSVQEAVGVFNEYLANNRKEFSENIKNPTAFDAGYYEGMSQDTVRVANEANNKINEINRQKLNNVAITNMQGIIHSGVKGEAFTNAMLPEVRKLITANRTPAEFAKAMQPVMAIVAEKDFTTDRVNLLANMMYDGDTKVRQHLNMFPIYQKIAKNFDQKVAEKAYKNNLLPDGTLDVAGFNAEIEALPGEFTGNSIPQVNMKTANGADLSGVSSDVRTVMPSIGGVLAMLGLSDTMCVTGGENGNLKVYIGEQSEGSKQTIQDNMNQCFSNVKIDGDTLTVGGYKGGLENAADPLELSASAYSPDRKKHIKSLANSWDVDARRSVARQKQANNNKAVLGVLGSTSMQEATEIINNSDMSPTEKESYLRMAEEMNKPPTNKQLAAMTKLDREMYDYSHSTLEGLPSEYSRNLALIEQWKNMTDSEKQTVIEEKKFAPFATASKKVLQYHAYCFNNSPNKMLRVTANVTDNVPTATPTISDNKDEQLEVLKAEVASAKAKGMDAYQLRGRIFNVVSKMTDDTGEINTLTEELMGGYS